MTLPTCPDCTYADVREVWQAEPVEVLSIPCAKHSRFRDAATGQYVTAEHAATNPATTVREDDSRVRELQRRLDKAASILRAASGTWDSAAEEAIGEALTALGVES